MEKNNDQLNRKTVKPPGERITEVIKKSRGSINFPESKSKSLLSPLVEALYNNGTMTITAVIFVAPLENEAIDLKIYQNWYTNIEGFPQLQFFVSYDMSEKVSKDFLVYEVTFDAKSFPFQDQMSQIKTIQTFLWDVDPVTSRGTVTTVQSGG
ncbi:hypothetical protein [Flavobacterium mesophilum]|uniref:hypothetical protein n=1 Tax=Flavobacterium mesophilum TaxID=3143495 RepID=UPI0031D5CB12